MLTMALLTMALLTVAVLTMIVTLVLTMAILTMATHFGYTLAIHSHLGCEAPVGAVVRTVVRSVVSTDQARLDFASANGIIFEEGVQDTLEVRRSHSEYSHSAGLPGGAP